MIDTLYDWGLALFSTVAWWLGTALLLGTLLLFVARVARRLRWATRRNLWVEADLRDGLRETPQQLPPFFPADRFQISSLELHALCTEVARDRKVRGVSLLLRAPVSLAQAAEVHAGALLLGSKQKPLTVFADSLGEAGPAPGLVAAAAGAGEASVHPEGRVEMTGLGAAVPFIQRALQTWHIDTHFSRRSDWKTAPNMFTHSRSDTAQDAQIHSLLEAQQATIAGMLSHRTTGQDDVPDAYTVMEQGPYTAEQAVARKLIDHTETRSEYLTRLAGADPRKKIVPAFAYPGVRARKPVPVAVVYVEGAIVSGRSNPPFGNQSPKAGSDSIARYLRSIRLAGDTKAIVLRIDSPGGSALASDVIAREISACREAGIPVVASMGTVAASGGYYVAAPCNHIVAQPGTITGSIGVYGGRFGFRRLWERLGITFETYSTSANALYGSSLDDISAQELIQTEEQVESIYRSFTKLVSTHRGLDADTVQQVAGGRVWNGTQALEHGLVDSLGGWAETERVVRRMADIRNRRQISWRVVGQPRTVMERLSTLPLMRSSQPQTPLPAAVQMLEWLHWARLPLLDLEALAVARPALFETIPGA